MIGIAVEFNQFNFVPEMTETVETALVRALNKAADMSRTRAARAVREQVAFPASYVSPANKRLWVSRRAKQAAFEAVVEGRGRATSLARFSKQKPLPPGKRHRDGQIAVTVKPGVTRKISRAFMINLNNGNVGLAVRTDGPPPRGAYKPKSIGKNLWLLYGPSVDQALSAASDGDGVYAELSPETLEFVEAEFNRQMDLLEKRNA